MKKLSNTTLSAVLVVAALFISVRSSSAQWCDCEGQTGKPEPPPTTVGTEFLLVFMQNEMPGVDEISLTTYQDVYIAAAEDKPAEVTITCKAYPNMNIKYTVAPNASVVHRFPDTNTFDNHVLVQTTEFIEPLVIKVVSTAPIICYGMNHKNYTADAFIALPRSVAKTEYHVMSYPNSRFSSSAGNNRPSEFSVAAFDDNTTVTIIPSTTTSGNIPKGQATKYILNAGDCVQLQAMPNDLSITADLSGSVVKSDKPVVVYGGHVRAEVPAGFAYSGGTNSSRDHLAEAIPPISTWGKSFITSHLLGRDTVKSDLVRVQALNNNTTISINGNVWGMPLNSGQVRDTLVEGIVSIEATDQVLVGLLAHTTNTTSSTGDPFLAIVPPLDQTFNDFKIFLSTDPVYTLNAIQIVTESTGVGLVKINGQAIPAAAFTTVPGQLNGKSWAMATVVRSGGSYHITSPNMPDKGITVLGYGFGTVDSYGYTAGALLRPLNGIRGGLLEPPTPQAALDARPRAHLRSILVEKVFLDSVQFTHSHSDKYSVSLQKKTIWGELTSGEERAIDLAVTPANTTDVINGTMRVWHHTTKSRKLWPVDVPFTIYPQTTASVRMSDGSAFALSTFPNPVTGDKLRVSFTVPERTMIHARLIDVTGREAAQIVNTTVSEGVSTFSVDARNIANGMYMCEIVAPELGISERKQVVIMK